MKILIEGEAYPLLLLEEILEDASFYTQDNSKGTITTVGYYYSSEKKFLCVKMAILYSILMY